MKRPLLPVACLLIGGILCGEFIRPGVSWLLGGSFLVAAAALAWERGRPWLIGFSLVLTGWTNAVWRHAILSPSDLRALAADHPEYVTVRGVVRAPPSQRIFQHDQREFSSSSVLIETDELLSIGPWQPAAGRVVAVLPGILPTNIFEGQRVEASGLLQRPHGPYARGMFHPRAFYEREGVFFQLQTSGTNDWKTEAGPCPMSERFRGWARRTLAVGLPDEDEPLRLTWTLLLDWKTPLTPAVEEPFLRAGTYHIFAVDGLRIGLLAVMGVGLLRLLQLPRSVCGALVLPALWAYAGLTGWPASAVRAAIMASVILVGWACRRPVDLINSLFAAAVVVLLWDPAQLFQPGFQLSFLVVLCIGVILPKVRQTLRGWLLEQSDPFLPDTLRARGPAWLHTPAAYFVDTLAMSFAAWVGSIPLSAYYFHLVTPISVPANCVVVPATALALMSGMGSLLTGAWLPGLAGLFNNATWALMKFIIWFSELATRVPAGNVNIATPAPSVCVFYYMVLLMIATGWIFRTRFKRATCAVLLALVLGGSIHWALGWRSAHLDILPMNGAPVVCVDAPGIGKRLLVNCGGEDAARELLKPFLCAQGVNHLAALCLAVGRLDYFGGARLILSNFPAAQISTGAAPVRSPAFRELLSQLHENKNWQPVRDGEDVDGWTVMHPGPSDQFAQADDNAIVLWREFYGRSVLLLPALGRDGQDSLARRHPELRAEFVVAGLDARDEPLCEPLLDLLQPKVIVLVDSTAPATRRAPAKLRQRLARRGARVVYSRYNGSLTLQLTPSGWSLSDAEGHPPTEAPPFEPEDSP